MIAVSVLSSLQCCVKPAVIPKRVVAAVLQRPPLEWKRRYGRPATSWLLSSRWTLDSVLPGTKCLTGVHWHKVVSTATHSLECSSEWVNYPLGTWPILEQLWLRRLVKQKLWEKWMQHLGVLRCAVRSGSVASVGVMSHTLRVQATDEVYKTTKEKMTLADKEVKKVRWVSNSSVMFVVIITAALLVIITGCLLSASCSYFTAK